MKITERSKRKDWLLGIGSVAVCTGVAALMHPYFTLVDVAMVYLLGIVIVSSRTGKWTALLATFLSVAAFDFFFVPPFYTFAVHEARYFLTFIVMFIVASVISRLTLRIREQANERARLAGEAQRALLKAETEALRNTLLSSVSHDLRTPLAAITGAATALLQKDITLDKQGRQELVQTIFEEAERLNKIIRNVLDMTRLDAKTITVKKEWQSLEEIIGVAFNRLGDKLKGRPFAVNIPMDLPLVSFDPLLIEQVLMNLLDNAVKYTPRDTPLDLSARVEGNDVVVELADQGPGIPPGDEERIFEKFVRGPATDGIGLGLTICRAIINSHGGRIWAEKRPGGGTIFRFTLPIEGEPQMPEPEEIEER